MMCFQGPLICYARLCFSYAGSASGYTNAVFQSIFSTFLCRFTQNLFMYNVFNFEYRHSFIACKSLLYGYET